MQRTAVAVAPRAVDAHAGLETRKETRRRLFRGGRRRERVRLFARLYRLLAKHRVQTTRVLKVLRLFRLQRAQENGLGLLRDLRYVLHTGGAPSDLDFSHVLGVVESARRRAIRINDDLRFLPLLLADAAGRAHLDLLKLDVDVYAYVDVDVETLLSLRTFTFGIRQISTMLRFDRPPIVARVLAG